MKPGKPSKVEFMLFPAAGSAYIKTFNAGTERTKYSFPVPSFVAKNMAGALTIGEPAKPSGGASESLHNAGKEQRKYGLG